jgi:L-2-hydroxyglutarate oxidase LhgO
MSLFWATTVNPYTFTRPVDGPREVAIIGAGIIGLATAWSLLQRRAGMGVTVLEKEPEVALHQTGRNSGVVHAGIYYKPGSLKARLCSSGRLMLREFCIEYRIPYQECGKVLVATNPREISALGDLFERGAANHVPRLTYLSATELREVEPYAVGQRALHSPVTAITDFAAIARKLAELVTEAGGRVLTNSRVVGMNTRGRVVVHLQSSSCTFDHVVVCAGLQSDELARMAGDGPDPQIIPFRGEYMRLRSEREHLVRGLIYPVPDPRYPFLGIHLTRTIGRGVLLGPSAILAGAKEGYHRTSFDRTELTRALSWPGFRKMARRHWRAGVAELYKALNRRAFVGEARKLVRDLSYADVTSAPSGVRAQAVSAAGALIDDFWINAWPSVTNVRNAPSPGATSSLAIGEMIADAVLDGRLPQQPA